MHKERVDNLSVPAAASPREGIEAFLVERTDLDCAHFRDQPHHRVTITLLHGVDERLRWSDSPATSLAPFGQHEQRLERSPGILEPFRRLFCADPRVLFSPGISQRTVWMPFEALPLECCS